jgi:hypothetical protein
MITGLFELGLSLTEDFGATFQERFLGNESDFRFPAGLSSFQDSATRIHMDHYEIGAHIPGKDINKRIFDTSKGYLGSGPSGMLPDDEIWFLPGCEFLLVLRKVNGHYVYVGLASCLDLWMGN